jgi:hypothetical protein
MVFHPLAEDHFVLVVVAIGERIAAFCAFKLDGRNAFEKISH